MFWCLPGKIWNLFQGIVIGWDPPPEGTQNGMIEGYKIEYKQRKDKINLNAMVEGGKRSFDFTGNYGWLL